MKKILITGCSSGLGLALTNLYLEKKYKVYGISRKNPNINESNFTHISCDLSKVEDIKNCLENSILKLENINLVYLNAGMLGEIKTLNELGVEALHEVYNLNVYANKELLDILSKIKVEKIIAISSGASVNGLKGWSSYCLSKAGLNMLINLYSKEMTTTKLLSIAPGVIKTPMTDYIRFEVNKETFPSANDLNKKEVQTPMNAAKRLDDIVQRFDEFESGSFIDVRKV